MEQQKANALERMATSMMLSTANKDDPNIKRISDLSFQALELELQLKVQKMRAQLGHGGDQLA